MVLESSSTINPDSGRIYDLNPEDESTDDSKSKIKSGTNLFCFIIGVGMLHSHTERGCNE